MSTKLQDARGERQNRPPRKAASGVRVSQRPPMGHLWIIFLRCPLQDVRLNTFGWLLGRLGEWGRPSQRAGQRAAPGPTLGRQERSRCSRRPRASPKVDHSRAREPVYDFGGSARFRPESPTAKQAAEKKERDFSQRPPPNVSLLGCMTGSLSNIWAKPWNPTFARRKNAPRFRAGDTIDVCNDCTQNGSIRARPNMTWNRSQKMMAALYFSRSTDAGRL